MRRIVRKDNSYRKKILSIGLVIFVFMGIGYSVISTNLMFNGNIELSKYESPYLYDVLKNEALSGGVARKYTGNHHDSFTEEPSKDIYHWYASNNDEGRSVINKNNVIFANHCWQMVRTTDTGGVKMIYNGEVDNGQCLDTRSYSGHVGYNGASSVSLNSNYWYGTDYIYNKDNNNFSLSGTTFQETWSDSTYENLIGKYTCGLTSVDGTCSSLVYVVSYSSSTGANIIRLKAPTNYSIYGVLPFNRNTKSTADVGYMYNASYPYKTNTIIQTENILSSDSLSTSYWFAHNVVWGTPQANTYNLDTPYQVSSTSDYPNLVGEYTFRSSSQTYTTVSVSYIAGVSGTTMYYLKLNHSTNHNLADVNYKYTYSDSYTDNGDNTYTINNPTTIERKYWFTSYNNIGSGKYVCKNAVNNTCSDLWYTTETTNETMNYIKVNTSYYKYAKGFTYNSNTGVYTLSNEAVSFFDISDVTNQTSLANAHYTCWNSTGECSTISYVFNVSENNPSYIELTGGKSIEDALSEMLNSNGVNTVNSVMKTGIDLWYKQYMLDYDDYLEDVIYCNNRSISDLGGWNPNGGSVSDPLKFREYNITNDFSCENVTDQFSVSNSAAQLTYKVGMLTVPEVNISNNSIIRKVSTNYYLMSPNVYKFWGVDYMAHMYLIPNADNITAYSSDSVKGVRPVISLKPGTKFIYGNGSMEDPYVVKPKRDCTYSGELTQGAEFTDGQYTYRYMQKYGVAGWKNNDEDGWSVMLTDLQSTDPVNTRLCTTINNKPIVSMNGMFLDSQATSIDVSSFDTSNVTDMSYMFDGSKVIKLDLRGFDTNKVTSMRSMFESSSATSIDLSNFDTHNVTNMSNMFKNSSATSIDLSNFDTHNVTDMSNMFKGSSATSIDVSSFKTNKVTSMRSMFESSSATSIDISSFNNSNVTDSISMFCHVNQDIITGGSKFTFNDEMFNCVLG